MIHTCIKSTLAKCKCTNLALSKVHVHSPCTGPPCLVRVDRWRSSSPRAPLSRTCCEAGSACSSSESDDDAPASRNPRTGAPSSWRCRRRHVVVAWSYVTWCDNLKSSLLSRWCCCIDRTSRCVIVATSPLCCAFTSSLLLSFLGVPLCYVTVVLQSRYAT